MVSSFLSPTPLPKIKLSYIAFRTPNLNVIRVSPLPFLILFIALVNLSILLGNAKYDAVNNVAKIKPVIIPILCFFNENIIQNHIKNEIRHVHNIPALDVKKKGMNINIVMVIALNILKCLYLKNSTQQKTRAVHEKIDKYARCMLGNIISFSFVLKN